MVTAAAITAKNEAATIGGLVRALRECGPVIVVNDGSSDSTGQIAQASGAAVIHHTHSLGIGCSLMEAWGLALGYGADYVVQLDAGGSHDPRYAAWMLDIAQERGADVLVGSRFMPCASYQGRPWRAFASRCAARLMSFAAHARISDWTSGYRVFSRAALERLLAHSYAANMHAWQMEVLVRALDDGLVVAEHPITYRAGASSMRLSTVDEAINVFLWTFFR